MIKVFLGTATGRALLICAACGIGFVALSLHERSKGAATAVAKIEKKDAANVSKAQAVGAKSRNPSARGLRDIHVRADD